MMRFILITSIYTIIFWFLPLNLYADNLGIGIGSYEPRDGLLRSLYKESPRSYNLSYQHSIHSSQLNFFSNLSYLNFESGISNLESYTSLYNISFGLAKNLSPQSNPISFHLAAGVSLLRLEIEIEDEQQDIRIEGEKSWALGSFFRMVGSYQLHENLALQLAISEQNVLGRVYGNINLSGHALTLYVIYQLWE